MPRAVSLFKTIGRATKNFLRDTGRAPKIVKAAKGTSRAAAEAKPGFFRRNPLLANIATFAGLEAGLGQLRSVGGVSPELRQTVEQNQSATMLLERLNREERAIRSATPNRSTEQLILGLALRQTPKTLSNEESISILRGLPITQRREIVARIAEATRADANPAPGSVSPVSGQDLPLLPRNGVPPTGGAGPPASGGPGGGGLGGGGLGGNNAANRAVGAALGGA